jgi:hypothetical protein
MEVGFSLDGTAILPVTRTGFEVGGIGELRRAGPIAGQVSVGVEA